jgi:hypothetical protein
MSLAELTIVIALSSIVMAMAFAVVTSFARNDARNVARENRVSEVRKVALWLGDALAYAESPNAGQPGAGAVFATAEAKKMVFTSALGEGATQHVAEPVSQVKVVLGETCSGAADPGVLRRCVLHPFDGAPQGTMAYCGFTGACPDGLREETVLARGVKDQPLFTYFNAGALTPGSGFHEAADEAARAAIAAVEFKVTVTGSDLGKDTESTVFKRFTLHEWRQW